MLVGKIAQEVFPEASMAIEDGSDQNDHELTVFFRDGRDFAALFSSHLDYIAYYADAGNGS